MKYLFVIVFLIAFCFQDVKAQFVTYQDGSPAREIKLVNVEGSELLYPDWQSGAVKVESGKVYSNIMLKYNVYEDQLYFLGKDNQAMKFNNAIVEFQLGNNIFRNGYPAIRTFNNLSYFIVMTEGKATLLKKITKSIADVKEFNSSVSTKKIADDKSYYLLVGGKITQVKIDKASFINVLLDKKNDLELYLKTNKTNFKKDEELVEFIKNYNLLK